MLNSIGKIAYKELLTACRNKVVLLNAGMIMLLLLVAAYGGYRNYQRVQAERTRAQVEKRQQWLNQDPKHPHIAAHFGTFAYKPKTVLSLIDAGLDNYAGSYAYLEPHRQNDFVFKPAEEYSGAIRFGQLSVALVLQLLIPLLIIFTGFAAVTRERENGTLPLLYSYGVSVRQVAAGKILGLYAALQVVLLPALAITVFYLFAQSSGEPGGELWSRSVLLLAVYSVYFLLCTLVTVCVSALCRKSRSALLILLGAWIACCVIAPKTVANMGSNRYPLPSQYAFREAIQTDINNGLDGHNSKDKRAKELEASLLKQYHVTSVAQLPFNFEGYIMQAGEAYSSKVYDKHFHALQQTLVKEERFGRYLALVDPYLAVQNISMGLSSTDIFTHIHFQQQAEAYRRSFVQQMNEDMKDHSRLGDWNYKSNKSLYAAVPDFRYSVMPVAEVLRLYRIEIISLLGLLLISLALLYFVLNKIPLVQTS